MLLYRHCQPLFPYEWGKTACCDVLQGKAYPKKKEALNLFYYALLKYITYVVVLFDAHMNLLGHIHQHLWNSLMINI